MQGGEREGDGGDRNARGGTGGKKSAFLYPHGGQLQKAIYGGSEGSRGENLTQKKGEIHSRKRRIRRHDYEATGKTRIRAGDTRLKSAKKIVMDRKKRNV